MYKFYNFPKKIGIEEYQRQEKEFLNFLEKQKNIISIYSIGELELLGVSDLDYLIIFKKEVDRKKILNFRKEFDLIDTIIFLDIKKIENINYLSHHFNYKLIFGKDLNLKFDKKNKNLNIIYAWKICFFSLLRNFYWYKYNKEIYIKNLLSQINDIRYPIFFLKNLGIEKEEYNNFIKEFQNFRKTYFEHKNFKKLEEYLEESIKLSWKIIFDLNKFLIKTEKKSFIYGRFPTIFCNFNNFEKYKEITEKKLKIIGKISRFLYLPTGFDYRKWDGSLKKDLEKIILNNKKFLNFGLKGFKLNLLLFIKKVFDFITIKLLEQLGKRK